MGTKIPEWATLAGEDKEALDRIAKEPVYEGLAVRIAFAGGKDIDLIKKWVRNEIAVAIARQIIEAVTVESGQGMQGDKDSDKYV